MKQIEESRVLQRLRRVGARKRAACLSLGAVPVALVVALGSSATGAAVAKTSRLESHALSAFNAKVAADVAKATKFATYKSQPTPSSGPKAVHNKLVVVIPPGGPTTEGGYEIAKDAENAAKTIGWKVKFINPNSEVTQEAAAVEDAINLHAAGIITVSIDGGSILSQLKQARADGIDVVTGASANSNGESGVYQAVLPTLTQGYQDGYLLGEEAYEKTDHHLRDIEFMDSEFGFVVARQKGWNAFIAACQAAGGDCKTLATTNFLAAEIATQLPQIAETTARAHPGYNVVWGGFDSSLIYVIQGLKSGGLEPKGTFAAGFDGNTPNLNLMRGGGYEQADVGLSKLWIGYALVDELNRLFAKQPVISAQQEGLTDQLLTPANLPKSGPFWGDYDVRPYYWKLWGVKPPASLRVAPADIPNLP